MGVGDRNPSLQIINVYFSSLSFKEFSIAT